jgi:hypothetical protein
MAGRYLIENREAAGNRRTDFMYRIAGQISRRPSEEASVRRQSKNGADLKENQLLALETFTLSGELP